MSRARYTHARLADAAAQAELRHKPPDGVSLDCRYLGVVADGERFSVAALDVSTGEYLPRLNDALGINAGVK